MVPLYRGLAIFGSACQVLTTDRKRGGTLLSTFGANNLEPGNDGGGRGRLSTIVGTLAGIGPTSLAAAEQAIRSCNDGQAGDFQDSSGTIWPNVLLHSFTPLGRVRQDPGGTLMRGFVATLLHLN